jgi:hypothetical protein
MGTVLRVFTEFSISGIQREEFSLLLCHYTIEKFIPRGKVGIALIWFLRSVDIPVPET